MRPNISSRHTHDAAQSPAQTPAQTAAHNVPRAFTLVEMLLVVAIIVLLLALLLPSLGKSKEHAHVVVCRSNLKQIGHAAVSYTADHANRYCDAFFWTLHVTCWHDWHQSIRVTDGWLFPYVRNENAYLCPTFMKVFRHGDQPFYCGDSGSSVEPVYSYTMNASMGFTGWGGFRWLSPRAIREPDKMLFYSEENAWVAPPWSTVSINNGALGQGPDCIATYHLPDNGDLNTGGGNVLFMDLHAELGFAEQTVELATQ